MMVKMRCEHCPNKEAAVRVLDVRTDGDGPTVTVREWCAACARSAGIAVPMAPGSHPAVLQMLAKAILPEAAAPREEAPLACPDCGWTLRDLRQSNRFGCPRDYDVFGAHVADLLDRLQGHAKHVAPAEEGELAGLQAAMQEAVAGEDYEEAARLRDRIREVESALEEEDVLD